MGIPNYFAELIRKHSSILKKFEKNKIHVHNLYIDTNSIVYDAVNSLKMQINSDYEIEIMKWVCARIEHYITYINPTNNVIIALDGVAPVAKLEQQRNRRYKSWIQKNEENEVSWDTCSITPGTLFMNKLNKYIHNYFSKYNNECLDVIIYDSDEPGEGEHKIFEYMRQEKEYHNQTNTIIYGLDADLIMLSLIALNISSNIFLFRETPHFINSLNKNLSPNEQYLLDIYELGEEINDNMRENNNEKDCIHDYIFLCFFLGNDFLPHFPVLSLRSNGISYLLGTYKMLFGSNNDTIIKDNKIIWKNLRKIIQELANNEEQYGIEEMKLRRKMSEKLKKRSDLDKKLNIPLLDRRIEEYINIGRDGWQSRYYKELFQSENNENRCKQFSLNYLEGLEWTFKYYTSSCPDWRWKYNYNYPPLLCDLIKFVPYFDTDLIEIKTKNPVNKFVQLSYVLPRNSLSLLPLNLYKYLIFNHSDWYRLDYCIIWAFCRYLWEGHVEMDEINIDILTNIINNI
jgi:5'-3' exonuclease